MLAEKLKNETRQAHKQLDRHPLLVQLLQPNLSAENYELILTSMYRAQSRCETALSAAAHKFSDHQYLHQPSRLPLLAADMNNLRTNKLFSNEALSNNLLSIPLVLAKETQLSCDSIGAYIGMAYVLEGSALGGQHIARYLCKSSPQLPTQFFASQDIDCKHRWNIFWEFANKNCFASDFACAISSALKTFQLYEQHMDFCLNDYRQ